MRNILVLIFGLICSLSFSQDLEFYYPDGKFITKGATVNTVLAKYFPEVRLTHNPSIENSKMVHNEKSGVFAVYFNVLSNEPLFVLAYPNPTQNQIDSAVNSFNLEEYYNSWKFEFDIRTAVKSKKLTDIDLYKAFGKPIKSNVTSDGTNSIKTLAFGNPSVIFILRDGIVESYNLTQ